MCEPGLFFLVDSIQKYLFFLRNKKLAVFHWEIFQADFTKAAVLTNVSKMAGLPNSKEQAGSKSNQ